MSAALGPGVLSGTGGEEECRLNAGERVKMTSEFPAYNGSTEGGLLPGLPDHLAMEHKCLGFLPCECVHAYTAAGSPIHSVYNRKGLSNINF